jgi:hypothetical protein
VKSELFVINNVKFSEQAFSAVAELIPCRDLRELLKILQRPEELRKAAANLRVEYEAVFTHLEKAILDAFNRQVVARLTRDHLRLLQNADVQYALSELLGCEPNSALQTLFSVPSLQQTMESLTAGSAPSLGSNAAQLLGELLKLHRVQQLELDYVTSENDWEPIVNGEEWLSPLAADALKLVASGERITSSCALAEFVNKTLEDKSETEGINLARPNVLGPLGLIALRRRLMWIQESLRNEIIECGKRAAATIPGSPSVKMLFPVLQLYEFGNIAKGLSSYINHGHVLKDLLPMNSETTSNVDQDKVVQDRPLVFSGESKYDLAGDQVGTFGISCYLTDQRQPQNILRVTDVKAWVYRQLSQDIPKLTPAELSTTGEQLYERLLNTSFPLLDPQTRRLREVINKLDLAFLRAVALCCKPPIDQTPDLFRGELSFHLPYEELPSVADPLYPKEVEDIIELHKSTYQNSLRVERGAPLSDPSSQLP